VTLQDVMDAVLKESTAQLAAARSPAEVHAAVQSTREARRALEQVLVQLHHDGKVDLFTVPNGAYLLAHGTFDGDDGDVATPP
jgi:hypothetical protein